MPQQEEPFGQQPLYDPTTTKQFHGYISPQARDEINRVADEAGVSVNSFMEALGRAFKGYDPNDSGWLIDPDVLFERARVIDNMHRRRPLTMIPTERDQSILDIPVFIRTSPQ